MSEFNSDMKRVVICVFIPAVLVRALWRIDEMMTVYPGDADECLTVGPYRDEQ